MEKESRLNLTDLEGRSVSLDGNSRAFLEIKLLENGNFYVSIFGQEKVNGYLTGKLTCVTAQVEKNHENYL